MVVGSRMEGSSNLSEVICHSVRLPELEDGERCSVAEENLLLLVNVLEPKPPL